MNHAELRIDPLTGANVVVTPVRVPRVTSPRMDSSGSKKLTLQSLPAAISAPSSTQARTGVTWLARPGPRYRTRLPPSEYSSG
jgi:hypothetical protein